VRNFKIPLALPILVLLRTQSVVTQSPSQRAATPSRHEPLNWSTQPRGTSTDFPSGLCAALEERSDEGHRALRELPLRYEGGTAGVDDLALLAATLGEWCRDQLVSKTRSSSFAIQRPLTMTPAGRATLATS
jgi:hypothetical protein